jgi:branched-chain amino acid transport system permease protein
VAYATAPKLGAVAGVILGIASGGVVGLMVERFVVRRLRSVSQTAQTVGTVAVFAVLVPLIAKIWGTNLKTGVSVVPHRTFPLGNALLSTDALALFFAAVLGAMAFFALFKFTSIGLAMRLAADNRRAAALMGIDPERTTAFAWLLGGLFAGLGGVLLAGDTGLHPYNLSLQVLPAFVAALIGGLGSTLGALAGAAAVGLAIGLVPSLGSLGQQPGAAQLALTVLAFAIMALRGGRLQTSDVRAALA